MLKALISDTHFGARSDNSLFYEYHNLFLTKVFFPTLEQRGIEKIIHLGDLTDRRKYINFNTLNWVREHFADKLGNYELDIILGNHDTYYKNTNSINSPELLLKEYPNIKIFTKPTEVDGVLYLPWINAENREDVLTAINDTSCKVAMGHLEIAGYTMFKGVTCTTGMDPSIFHKFDSVYSGHFHTKNSHSNIHYLGSPWDIIFTDADDVKGFHIYDDEEDSIEFIENPYKMYWKLYYDDSGASEFTQIKLRESFARKLINSFVKVYVRCKSNPIFFDRYMEQIQEQNPAVLIIIEDYANSDSTLTLEEVSPEEDTLSLIKSSIEDYNDLIYSDETKTKLEQYLTQLYMKALQE